MPGDKTTEYCSVDELNKVLGFAAEDGLLDIVDRLLQDPRITPDGVSRALDNAARFLKLNVIARLLQDPRIISIDRLLQDPRITSVGVNKVFDIAAWKGHLDIVYRLAQDPRITPDRVEQAFYVASRKGHFDVTVRLLQDDRLVPYAVDIALMAAALYGYSDLVVRLLQDDRITSDWINRALDDAAWKGHLAIVDRLLKDNRITINTVNKALDTAARKGHLAVVDRLLKDNRITTTTVNKALDTAASNGYFDIIPSLLQKINKDSVTAEQISHLFSGAVKHKHFDISNLLADYISTLPDETKKKAAEMIIYASPEASLLLYNSGFDRLLLRMNYLINESQEITNYTLQKNAYFKEALLKEYTSQMREVGASATEIEKMTESINRTNEFRILCGAYESMYSKINERVFAAHPRISSENQKVIINETGTGYNAIIRPIEIQIARARGTPIAKEVIALENHLQKLIEEKNKREDKNEQNIYKFRVKVRDNILRIPNDLLERAMNRADALGHTEARDTLSGLVKFRRGRVIEL